MLRTLSRAFLVLASAATTEMQATPAIADANIKIYKADVRIDGNDLPTFRVRFDVDRNRWIVADDRVKFDLFVHIRLNASSKLVAYAVDAEDDVRLALGGPGAFELSHPWYKSKPGTSFFDPDALTHTSVVSIFACQRALPNGRGNAMLRDHMNVELRMTILRWGHHRFRNITRALPFAIECTGAAENLKPDGPTRKPKFVLRSAKVSVTEPKGACPKQIYVTTHATGNKEGKLRYTLVRTPNAKWKHTLRVHQHDGTDWWGSYAHTIRIKKPGLKVFWMEDRKGNRLSKKVRAYIRC